MKKTKIYLNQHQQKSPTPLTPTDEAWNKMAELLDSEMPASDQKSKKRAFAISFSQLAISIVAAIVLVGGGTFITLRTIEKNKKEIHNTKQQNNKLKNDSLANKILLSEDTIVSADTAVNTLNNSTPKANDKSKIQQHQDNNQTSLSTVTKTQNPPKAFSVKISNLSTALVDSSGLNINYPISLTNPIDTDKETAQVERVGADIKPSVTLPRDENADKVEIKTETNLNDSLKQERNTSISNPITKKKMKRENFFKNFPRNIRLFEGLFDNIGSLFSKNSNSQFNGNIRKNSVSSFSKNNHLFIGLSGYNDLLFSKNASKNIYSYGEILTIGIRNIKQSLAVETGIGFQSLEYHLPYSRKLYTYQATGIYDSTITVSSYKYSRYNLVIPLFITKEIFHYNNIFLDVKTGVSTSIFLSKQRLFNQLPADIKLIEDSYQISNVNFSFAISPQFRWDINDKFSLNINAGGIFYLNSLYQNNSLKPIGINLSAGIHYYF